MQMDQREQKSQYIYRSLVRVTFVRDHNVAEKIVDDGELVYYEKREVK